ncbi:J domain-containing protein [Synechococcus sp. CCY9201]|uniref:J domain-containing protein n=1 Tax=Synechococcus sp. CCY9201 TaxID=174697 RepID=UPI002B219019|nr:J domain-containing protein [Synechococcus sp. CCY9201]MEA5474520.1 J domain-containing protein [Synechococcus sp. CCY9201]
MGFDPRSWARTPSPGRQVTCNIDSLLAENEALRQEVMQLRQQLAQLQTRGFRSGVKPSRPEETTGPSPRITVEQVRRWGEAMADHPRWSALRVGTSLRQADTLVFSGLRGLIEERRRHGQAPRADLEQELNRRSPGLGTELRQALRGPQTKARLAVKATFALYGVRAPEWLNEAPMRVVDDLLDRITRLEAAARTEQQAQQHTQRQRQEDKQEQTRRQKQNARQQQQTQTKQKQQRHQEEQRQTHRPPAENRVGMDRQRAEALDLLGLRWGASREAVKQAHRRLVKTHHPDRGGNAASFQRIHAAYQLLIA